MSSKISVIKIGGAVVEDASQMRSFIDALKDIEGPKLLVHGGGRKATRIAEQLDIKSEMINGRRVTSAELLDVVTMVYSGLNKQIVARLQQQEIPAIGLTGADLKLIPAHKRIHTEVDYGFAGDFHFSEINTTVLELFFDNNILPVVCALTYNKNSGGLLNTNADTIAQGLASALARKHEVHLIYAFEKAGLLRDVSSDDSIIEHVQQSEFDELISNGVIAEGMLPKVENISTALDNGVRTVRITRFSNLESGTTATL